MSRLIMCRVGLVCHEGGRLDLQSRHSDYLHGLLNPKAHWMAGFGPYGKRQAICKKP